MHSFSGIARSNIIRMAATRCCSIWSTATLTAQPEGRRKKPKELLACLTVACISEGLYFLDSTSADCAQSQQQPCACAPTCHFASNLIRKQAGCNCRDFCLILMTCLFVYTVHKMTRNTSLARDGSPCCCVAPAAPSAATRAHCHLPKQQRVRRRAVLFSHIRCVRASMRPTLSAACWQSQGMSGRHSTLLHHCQNVLYTATRHGNGSMQLQNSTAQLASQQIAMCRRCRACVT